MEQRNEPTTEEIVKALRCDGFKGTCSECFFGFEEKDSVGYDTWECKRGELDNVAADRFELIQRELFEKSEQLEAAKARHARKDAESAELYEKAVARAERAETERDKYKKLYEEADDALEECTI